MVSLQSDLVSELAGPGQECSRDSQPPSLCPLCPPCHVRPLILGHLPPPWKVILFL